jgi:hypothetical protein
MMRLHPRHAMSIVTMCICMVALLFCVASRGLAAQGKAPKPSAADSQDAAQASDGPRILIEETVYDFGEVYEGASVEHGFTVKNTGLAVLNISQVRPG